MKNIANKYELRSDEIQFAAAAIAIGMKKLATNDGGSNQFYKNVSIGQTDIFTSLSNMVHDYKSNTLSSSSMFSRTLSSATNSKNMDIPSKTMIRKQSKVRLTNSRERDKTKLRKIVNRKRQDSCGFCKTWISLQ